MRDIVLCHPVRTAIGGYGGSLKGTAATELGAAAIRETLLRSGLEPGRLGSVTMGNVVQAGNRMNPARQAAVTEGQALERAGWSLGDVERVAINEAFAVVPLAVANGSACPRTSSTSRAVPSRMGIPSARPVRC